MKKIYLEKFLKAFYKKLKSEKLYRVRGAISERPLFAIKFVDFSTLFPKGTEIYGFRTDGLWVKHIGSVFSKSDMHHTVWSPHPRSLRVSKVCYDIPQKKTVIEVVRG